MSPLRQATAAQPHRGRGLLAAAACTAEAAWAQGTANAPMVFTLPSWAEGLGTLLSLLLAAGWLCWSLWGWRKTRHPVDLAFAWAAAAWLTYLMVSPAVGLLKESPRVVFASYLGYQTLVMAVSIFLLTAAAVHSRRVYAVWWLQALLALAALAWHHATGSGLSPAFVAWKLVNLAGSTTLTVLLLLRVFHGRQQRQSMVVGACIVGLGVCIADLLRADGGLLRPTLTQHFYGLLLLAMWVVVTGRAGPAQGEARNGSDSEFAAQVLNHERHRISQDLHDGVGSQLVNILSSLDSHSPQQQALALALESCLVDLKIMVDSIDGAQDSVTDVLARLRYRVQHSLDKLGIAMVWNVEFSDALENLRGETAGQVLRVAQEALSNVMRHSGASRVEVACRVIDATQTICLEIRDNGRGGAEVATAGKGLQGMRRRASLVGGRLQIESPPGAGTRVEFCVPLAQASRRAPASPSATPL